MLQAQIEARLARPPELACARLQPPVGSARANVRR